MTLAQQIEEENKVLDQVREAKVGQAKPMVSEKDCGLADLEGGSNQVGVWVSDL